MKNINFDRLIAMALIVIGAIVIALIVGHYITTALSKRDDLMSKNIETAIAKGVDPLAVRCSYAAPHDQICIMYAASLK